jgi:MerR family mercuric resistance operon transcriptional regulator
MNAGLRIGELSQRCGVTPDTVRFYERRGLLPKPRRTAAQYRVYTDADEQRLRFIRQAQEWGLSLEDIRELLRLHELRSPDECRRVAARLRQRLSSIDRMIAELTTFKRRIAENIRRCARAREDTCPVVVDLFDRRPGGMKETAK